jgi:2-oxoglutarate ferredoxin oxidoreductase subunit alpha
MNLGQLSLLLRAEYLVDVAGYNQVNGMPIKSAELADAVTGLIEATHRDAAQPRQEVTS